MGSGKTFLLSAALSSEKRKCSTVFGGSNQKIPAASGKILIVEDTQALTQQRAEAIHETSSHSSKPPSHVVLVVRPEQIAPRSPFRWLRGELRRRTPVEEITLAPLGQRDASRLIRATSTRKLTAEEMITIQRRAAGLPLFLVALAGSDGATLPEEIRDAISALIAPLSDSARELLEVACLAGERFPLDLLLESESRAGAVDELLAGGFLVRGDSPSSACFRQPIVREALAEDLSWSARRRMHQVLAERSEAAGAPPLLLAEHYLGAGRAADARRTFVEAATAERHANAHGRAADALGRALDGWPIGESPAERVDVAENLARNLTLAGRSREAAVAWRQLIDENLIKSDAARMARALIWLSDACSMLGESDEAVSARDRAIALYCDLGDTALAARESIAQAYLLGRYVRLQAGLEASSRAIRLADELADLELRSRALTVHSQLLAMRSRSAEAHDFAREALEIALTHDLPAAAAKAYQAIAFASKYASDFPAQIETYRNAVDYCKSRGESEDEQVCLGCMSYSLFRAGDWKQSLRVARNLYEDEGARFSNAVARIAAGLIHAHRGEVRPASRLLLEADEVARKREAVMLQLLTGWGLGLLSEYSGDRDLAETHYRRLLALWERGAVINDAIPGLTAAAGFFSSRHAFAEAGACTDVLGSMLDSNPSPEVVSALAYVQGETAFFRGDAGARLLRVRAVPLPPRKTRGPARAHPGQLSGRCRVSRNRRIRRRDRLPPRRLPGRSPTRCPPACHPDRGFSLERRRANRNRAPRRVRRSRRSRRAARPDPTPSRGRNFSLARSDEQGNRHPTRGQHAHR